jgi:(1->4)-alpha-D-glucan 1-alpha-D-glucosylmutase
MSIFTPLATYRIQFHKDFRFRDLLPQIPYLAALGIDTIYASPIFTSRAGSTHGYDVTDANQLDPEIGTMQEFEELQQVLKQHNMKWLQDIVPNHMAFHDTNKWLMDVFEKGPQSAYYNFFDINWNHPDPKYNRKVMAPFLGAPLEEVIASGDCRFVFSEAGFKVQFYENKYPVSLQTWPELLEFILKNSTGNNEKTTSFGQFKELLEPYQKTEISEACLRKWEARKEQFLALIKKDPEQEKLLQSGLTKLNKNPERLTELLDKQVYRLEFWKVTDKQINYRRFFTINELLCLRMDREEVFQAYHQTVLEFVKKGYCQGLRIDHIDGLLDPVTYLNRLRQAAGPDCYLTIEKILEMGEELPETWPVQGTTGYFFLAVINQLFTRHSAAEKFDEIYTKAIGEKPDYEQMVFEKKIYMLENHMQGELENLFELMKELDLLPAAVNYPESHIKDALKILLASFPVYRLYSNTYPILGQDARVLEFAFDEAEKYARYLKKEFQFFYDLFQGFKENLPGKPENRLFFLMRSQQFTGPLAAKGVEDTTFYNYNRLISHNEVGDNPEVFGFTIEHFHKLMKERQETWPLAQNATATHDTKRGEDARVRLNVLTEIADEWEQLLDHWREVNQKCLHHLNGEQVPTPNRILFLYQALLGAFPMEGEPETNFLERVKESMTKAMREAKRFSNWSEPNQKYEAGVHEFTEAIFAAGTEFRKTFLPFVKKLNFYGMIYSLGQTLLKIAAPGIPDIYQGCELWDLSMVDPDNRRPVDFELRNKLLNELQRTSENGIQNVLKSLRENWTNGSIKLFTIWKALQARKNFSSLFTEGEYLALETSFSGQAQVLAFTKRKGNQWCLVLIPLNVVSISGPDQFPLGPEAWNDDLVSLPEGAPNKWKNLFTEEKLNGNGSLKLAQVFSSFPVALLIGE